jgi:hypothetical protein
MRLSEIQNSLFNLIAAIPGLAGVGVFKNDGVNEGETKANLREKALSRNGLAITVHVVDGGPIVTEGHTGKMSFDPTIMVTVEENGLVNRGDNGTQIPIEEVTQLILEHVCGKPIGCNLPNKPFHADSAVFAQVTEENGLRRSTIIFNKRTFITPTS